jgi:hypothetical protein
LAALLHKGANMFEKLSQAMRGNQNARKNAIKVGILSGFSTAGITTLVNTARRIADNNAAFGGLKTAKRLAGRPAAAAIKRDAIASLKKSAIEGAKQGAKRSAPLALGVGLGTGLVMHLKKK